MNLKSTLFILFVISICIPSAAQLQWAKYNGSLPPTAVIGGQENGGDLVVCRAMHNNAIHAGKVVGTNCNIGWGGEELVKAEFEVLVNNGSVRLSWRSPVNGLVPARAVEAGTEEGKKNYVGQATREDGTVHPGKIIGTGADMICDYGYGGAEITEKSNFKFLTTMPTLYWAPYAGTIPRNAVAGGKENQKSLTVCRASYEGAMHPGKVIGTNCNIGWGGKEVELPSFEVLLNGGTSINWVPFAGRIPKGAVEAGGENGKPLYVGQVTRADGSVHSGKILGEPGSYIFNYGYGGAEITVTSNFRILVQR